MEFLEINGFIWELWDLSRIYGFYPGTGVGQGQGRVRVVVKDGYGGGQQWCQRWWSTVVSVLSVLPLLRKTSIKLGPVLTFCLRVRKGVNSGVTSGVTSGVINGYS